MKTIDARSPSVRQEDRKNVEFPPDLQRQKLALDNLPDEAMVSALERLRGKGRNDFPVRAMWRALVAGFVPTHRGRAMQLP